MKHRPLFFILRLLMAGFAVFGLANAAPAQTMEPAPNTSLFTGKDAAAIIADAMAREGVASDIKISISEARDEDIIAQGSGPVTGDADGISIDKAHNRWEATLLLKAGGRNLAPIKLSGRYDEMASVPVLKRQVMPGEVIAQEDIDWDKEPALHLRKNTVTDPHDLIGKSPRHVISQGRAIRLDEIASPAILNKGTQVTLMYKSHNIEIETYGQALDSGAKGDVVRVRNTTSKAIIQGTVESGERVRVTSPETDAAEIGNQEPGTRSQE
jgi:flagella basal body P-ring formation protein FlgA